MKDNFAHAGTVLVVGAGNAALCAAIAARQAGADVIVLECAPREESGGNSRFTAGAMRFAYRGVDDIIELVPDLSEEERRTTDFGTYEADTFFDDMAQITQYRADPDLVEILVSRSFETLKWMRDNGIRFVPIYGRQAFRVDGKFKFWGGLTLETRGGGPGLVDSLTQRAEELGIRIRYDTPAVSLIYDGSRVGGVVARTAAGYERIEAASVVIASGGFEANSAWRTRYLGPGWDLAKVRGSRFNTGDGIRMALDIGASPAGHWSGCHAVSWERNAPEFGDLAIGDQFQKHSYPFGIVINARGERFLDEGADFRNYTYAKYGQEVLKQPGQFAWQVFDDKVNHLLRDEYRIKQITKVEADTLEDLAHRMEGVDPNGFLDTVRKFNAAVQIEVPFDPNVKDTRCTRDLSPPKSNWANPLDTPPFRAFAVTCGVTFTFGGLHISNKTEVLDTGGEAIPGLYAAGELVGRLFYFNYPGGTGLTSGAVFGRIAGHEAAVFAGATQSADTSNTAGTSGDE